MPTEPGDELALLVEKTRVTIERLRADREALRLFDPRVAGTDRTFDLREADATYTAAIDAAERTLDTLISAAGRAAESAGRAAEAPIQPRADHGIRDRPPGQS